MRNLKPKHYRLKATLLLFFLTLISVVHAQTWQQVWIDDFNGPNLDLSTWNVEVNAFGGYNNELQFYTDRSQNIRIENGALVIEGRKETFSDGTDTRQYTSARINSEGKRSWKYGRMEAKLKLPYGRGMWPAFWMMGNVGDWPANGEIDIMEMVGGVNVPGCGECGDNKTHGYAHWENNGTKSQGAEFPPLASGKYADAYHVFAVEWDTDKITWLIDDVVMNTVSTATTAQSEFDQPFYFLLNLAIGGDWPGDPDASTVFPQKMYIDYVRVLQKTSCTVPAQPAAIAGNTSVPAGSSQTYSVAAVSGATSYTWTLPSGWSGTSTSTSITTIAGSVGGTISVKANNTCGSSAARTLSVTVTSCSVPAQPGTISGNTTVTSGSNQTYSVTAVSGATSYTWTLPSGWSGSSTSASITTTAGSAGGTISVKANNSCGSSAVRTLSVTVSSCSVPAQPSTISGNTTVASGSSQTYSIAAVSGATSYTWTLPSGWSGSSISTSITSTAGSAGGTISVKANNACGSGTARTLSVTVSGNGFSLKIEAENYQYMSGITTQTCSEGGLNITSFNVDDWLSYPITIPTAGTYTASFRVSCTTTGKKVRFEKDNGNTLLGEITAPNTGGAQVWQTVNKNVTLPAGSYSVGLATTTGGVNINWFEIRSVTSGREISEEVNAEAEVAFVVPNPVEDVFTLKTPAAFKNGKVNILDMTGKDFTFTKLEEDTYDVSGMPSGLYVIRLAKGHKQLVRKFIKK